MQIPFLDGLVMGKPESPTTGKTENREQPKRQDENHYRGLFENMVEGFFLAEVICDSSGDPIDFRYIDVNPSFEALTGLSAEASIGKTAKEVVPGIEPEWIRVYGQVALTGKPAQLSAYAGPLQRYYETTAYSPKHGQFACLFTDATDRKRSEDALRASEQEARARAAELAAILDAVPAITFIAHDSECLEMTSSRAACELLGVPLGANTSKSAPLNDPPAGFQAMKDGQEIAPENLPVQLAARTGREVRNFEFELAFDNGVSRQLFGHAVPLFSERGEPRGSVGAFLDVTEQNRALKALRESEERFRTLADNISQFAWMADSSGALFWYNQRWYEYTGTTFEEMKGWGWQKVHHPDHLGRVVEKFKTHVESGQPWEDTFPLLGKDGTYRWFLSRALPIRDANGNVVRWFGTNTDVTEQRATEQALRTSEQLLRFHMENTPLAVVEWGADFRLSRWSSEAERMFGWRAEEVLGKRFDEFKWIYKEDASKVEDVSAGLVDGTRTRSVSRNRNYRKDGAVIHCEWYNSSSLDDSGKLISILSLVLDVTERKQAEEQLRATLESIADGFLALDQNWHFIYVNSAAEKLLNVSRSELLGKTGWENFPLALGAAPLHEYRLAAAGEIRIFETFSEALHRWFEIRCFPREGGGVSIYFQDITEQKSAEEALRTERDFSNAILNTAAALVVVVNPQGRITRFSKGCELVTGYSQAEALGLHVWNFVPEEDLQGVRKVFSQLCAGNFPNQHENYWLVRDGTKRLIAWSNTALVGESGKVEAVIATGIDITERDRVEQALRKSEEEFRELADAMPQIVWTARPDGAVDYFNRRWYEFTGAERRAGDEGWFPLTHPDDRERCVEVWYGCVQTGNPYQLECRLKRWGNNEYRWHLVRAFAVKDEAGNIVRWYGTSTDIHDFKQAQAALVRSEKLASVGRMAATVAHEINNPLAAVMNLLFLARTDRACPTELSDYLNTAESELKRVSHITRQVLGFYRESATPTEVSLAAIADESLEMFRPRLRAKHVTVDKLYESDVRVTAVGGELRQVLSNLIANSLDAVGNGGRIALRISRHNGRVRLMISDDGLGIDKDAQSRIFEPLFTTKESVGTGLGLWISKQLIEKNNGSIRFRSSTGPCRGTTFVITLPSGAKAAD